MPSRYSTAFVVWPARDKNGSPYRHAECDGVIGQDRICQRCGQVPHVADLIVHPPRRPRDSSRDDPVSAALRRPHRMLEPI
ncbi:hypothetical protein [Mycobacterium sp.]|uniref:hypothetical protein n=1 Tax=Mycobacterium sp. TaxID=1785 RepID=UPI0028BDFF4F|nr:hypothetical protein [Mycobacterium sp.]